MIDISPNITLDEREIHLEFIQSPGPGGQNVNKLATSVHLWFDVINSPSLTHEVRTRLMHIAGRRMTASGELHIRAQRYRTQEQNRRDAVERLIALIQQAAQRPKRRHKTKPTAASRERRLESKRQLSQTKQSRRVVRLDMD